MHGELAAQLRQLSAEVVEGGHVLAGMRLVLYDLEHALYFGLCLGDGVVL